MKSKPIQKQEQTKKQSIQNWEKEFVRIIKKYTHHIKGGAYFELIDGFIPLELFISNLLKDQETRNKKLIKTMTKVFEDKTDELLKAQLIEHSEMTKKLVAKKNKDCRRYLKEQKEEFIKIVEGMRIKNSDVCDCSPMEKCNCSSFYKEYNRAVRDIVTKLKENE